MILPMVFIISCNQERKEMITPGAEVIRDTLIEADEQILEEPPMIQSYSNERFRNVHVMGSPGGKYTVSGEAQVFEASFGWVVEDGHNELKSGHEMTDAGAPEWGKFSFEFEVGKARENSTLHVILFESSPRDGSRQHELSIPLP